jgi:hypothetical protein
MGVARFQQQRLDVLLQLVQLRLLGVATLLVLLPCCINCQQQLSSSLLAQNGYDINWQYGHATWYGNAYGEGSDGGACGYTSLENTPYGSNVAAGSAAVFSNGQGCGICYDVKCTYSICNSKPTRIVITDFCPGGVYCSTDEVAFDLSGTAMDSLAVPGLESTLRNFGQYDIQYMRVPCDYGGQNVAFAVDAGSSPYWLSFAVRYEGGPGDIESVMIRQSGSYDWVAMQHNWGASWMLIDYSGQAFRGPYDVQITAKLNGHSLIAWNAIPDYFQPGATYNSSVQLLY